MSLLLGSRLRHRVVPAGMEGLALEQPTRGEPAAAQSPVLLDRLERVLRARRIEAARVGQKRRDEAAVRADWHDQDSTEHALILGDRLPLDNWQTRC